MSTIPPYYCPLRGEFLNGNGGAGRRRRRVKYVIAVQYDGKPRQTSFLLRNLKNKRVVVRRRKGGQKHQFFRKQIKLVPGVRYQLNLRDSFGDGFKGFVEIYAIVNGVRKNLVHVDGGSFRKRRNQRFMVPRNIGRG